jgi:hypothetical protein
MNNTSDNLEELAIEIREAFHTVTPFIEKHTAIVCPECKNLCCKDKHGRHDQDDIKFLTAINEAIPPDQSDRDESGPCRYINEKGCSIERYLRPFRCTHFFCSPLLQSLENDNAKLYRAFVAYLQHLISIRQKLLDY